MSETKREGDVALETLASLREKSNESLAKGGKPMSEWDTLRWVEREIRAELKAHRARVTRAKKASR